MVFPPSNRLGLGSLAASHVPLRNRSRSDLSAIIWFRDQFYHEILQQIS
jgi:hypothetical protein